MNTFSIWRKGLFAVMAGGSLGQATLTGSCQSIISSGFEEFAVGTTPPFVVGNPNPAVTDLEHTPKIPPYEGTKYLVIPGSASLKSPNPDEYNIYGFSLSIYVPPPPTGFRVMYGARFGDYTLEGPLNLAGTWLPMGGGFSTPASQIDIYGFYVRGATTLPAQVGVDNVHFEAVPEPGTIPLLAGGLGIILVARSVGLLTSRS